MEYINDTKKRFIKEIKIAARHYSSFMFECTFNSVTYSDYELVDIFSEYLDELGFEDFKVSAFAEDNNVIVCKIKLKWEEKEKDSKFKLYNSVIEISRKHGVFFCDAVENLIDINIIKKLDEYNYPIILHLKYPENIKFKTLKGMIMYYIPAYWRKDSRVQQIVHPEYQTKYVEVIVNDYLHRFI